MGKVEPVSLTERLETVRRARSFRSLRAMSLECGLSHGTLAGAVKRERDGQDVRLDWETALKLEARTGFRARWIQEGTGPLTVDPTEAVAERRFPFYEEALQELIRDGIPENEARRLLNSAVAFDEGRARSNPFALVRLAKQIRAGIRGTAAGVREVDD